MIAKIMLSRERYQQVQHGSSEDDAGHNLHASFLPEPVHDENAQTMFPMKQGIFHFDSMETKLVPWSQYMADIKLVISGYENGPCLSGRSRLTTLTEKFELYSRLNSELEEESILLARRKGGQHRRRRHWPSQDGPCRQRSPRGNVRHRPNDGRVSLDPDRCPPPHLSGGP